MVACGGAAVMAAVAVAAVAAAASAVTTTTMALTATRLRSSLGCTVPCWYPAGVVPMTGSECEGRAAWHAEPLSSRVSPHQAAQLFCAVFDVAQHAPDSIVAADACKRARPILGQAGHCAHMSRTI